MSNIKSHSDPRYRVVCYVLDGEYRLAGDMGYRTFTSVFIGSSGEQYAVVQRPDHQFQLLNLWETREDSFGKIHPMLLEEFHDEDAAIVAACMRNL